jgi:predicted HTH transcriptional regulator
MLNTPFEKVSKEDIDALVSHEVAEGRSLDYKGMLPGNLNQNKVEFLADVASLANTSGGYLLYGVKERRDENGKPAGVPESADGLHGINVDQAIGRLESILRDNLDPRVPGVRMRAIAGFSNGPIVVVWVPKSWAAPHMSASAAGQGRR